MQQTIREGSADTSLFPMSSSSTASEGGKDDIIISDEKSVPSELILQRRLFKIHLSTMVNDGWALP